MKVWGELNLNKEIKNEEQLLGSFLFRLGF